MRRKLRSGELPGLKIGAGPRAQYRIVSPSSRRGFTAPRGGMTRPFVITGPNHARAPVALDERTGLPLPDA